MLMEVMALAWKGKVIYVQPFILGDNLCATTCDNYRRQLNVTVVL
jgi:hypothetical protein